MNSASANPPSIATPPSRGIATAWTSRSRGRAIAPHATAGPRAIGVAR